MMNQAGYDPEVKSSYTQKLVYKIKQNRKQARINLDSIDRGFLGNRRCEIVFFQEYGMLNMLNKIEKLLQKNLEYIFATIQNLWFMIQMKWYIHNSIIYSRI